jgi:hypothetical protein
MINPFAFLYALALIVSVFLLIGAWNRYCDARYNVLYPSSRTVFTRGAAHGFVMSGAVVLFAVVVAATIFWVATK